MEPVPHLQAPAAQVSARTVSHEAQAAPGVAQAAAESAWQVVPLQQPAAHEAESQTHAPLKQR